MDGKLENQAGLNEFSVKISIQTYVTTRINVRNFQPHFVENYETPASTQTKGSL